jgi:hypothetical protein
VGFYERYIVLSKHMHSVPWDLNYASRGYGDLKVWYFKG